MLNAESEGSNGVEIFHMPCECCAVAAELLVLLAEKPSKHLIETYVRSLWECLRGRDPFAFASIGGIGQRIWVVDCECESHIAAHHFANAQLLDFESLSCCSRSGAGGGCQEGSSEESGRSKHLCCVVVGSIAM